MRKYDTQLVIMASKPNLLRTRRKPYTGLDRPLGLQEVRAPRISRQSLEGGKIVSLTHRPPLLPRR